MAWGRVPVFGILNFGRWDLRGSLWECIFGQNSTPRLGLFLYSSFCPIFVSFAYILMRSHILCNLWKKKKRSHTFCTFLGCKIQISFFGLPFFWENIICDFLRIFLSHISRLSFVSYASHPKKNVAIIFSEIFFLKMRSKQPFVSCRVGHEAWLVCLLHTRAPDTINILQEN